MHVYVEINPWIGHLISKQESFNVPEVYSLVNVVSFRSRPTHSGINYDNKELLIVCKHLCVADLCVCVAEGVAWYWWMHKSTSCINVCFVVSFMIR